MHVTFFLCQCCLLSRTCDAHTGISFTYVDMLDVSGDHAGYVGWCIIHGHLPLVEGREVVAAGADKEQGVGEVMLGAPPPAYHSLSRAFEVVDLFSQCQRPVPVALRTCVHIYVKLIKLSKYIYLQKEAYD